MQVWSNPAVDLAASLCVRWLMQVSGERHGKKVRLIQLYTILQSHSCVLSLTILYSSIDSYHAEEGLTSSVRLMREESFVNSTRAFCMASSDSVTLNDTMRLFNVVRIIVSPAAGSNFFPMFECIRCKKILCKPCPNQSVTCLKLFNAFFVFSNQ